MADADKIISRVKRRLGRTRADNDIEILDEMEAFQDFIEQGPTMPWFLLENFDQTTPQAAGVEILTELVPADFLREFRAYGLYVYDDEGKKKACKKEDYEFVMAQTTMSGQNTPYYALLGDEILIRPTYDEEKTYGMWYYKSEDAVAAGESNGYTENLSEYMISWVAHQIGLGIESPKIQQLAQQGTVAHKRFISNTIAREEANVRRVMGD